MKIDNYIYLAIRLNKEMPRDNLKLLDIFKEDEFLIETVLSADYIVIEYKTLYKYFDELSIYFDYLYEFEYYCKKLSKVEKINKPDPLNGTTNGLFFFNNSGSFFILNSRNCYIPLGSIKNTSELLLFEFSDEFHFGLRRGFFKENKELEQIIFSELLNVPSIY